MTRNDRDSQEYSAESSVGEQHVITVESTQIWRGEVTPPLAPELTSDATRTNILGEQFHGQGVDLQFVEEAKVTYECSCGEQFRKGETAREHLEEDFDDE